MDSSEKLRCPVQKCIKKNMELFCWNRNVGVWIVLLDNALSTDFLRNHCRVSFYHVGFLNAQSKLKTHW